MLLVLLFASQGFYIVLTCFDSMCLFLVVSLLGRSLFLSLLADPWVDQSVIVFEKCVLCLIGLVSRLGALLL